MQRHTRTTIIAALVAISCTACVPSAPDGPTLAETKSPAQLFRNESVLRLPATDVDSVQNSDESRACDGDELIRRWVSTATITLTATASQVPDQAMATLAESFEADGWVLSPGNERLDDEQAVLTSGTSSAEIRLISYPSEDGSLATIAIESAGPCVITAGPDSEEVKQLEDPS